MDYRCGVGVMSALVELDPAAFRFWMEIRRTLNAQVRDFVRANADKYFQEMAQESEKRAAK